jgi:ribonuclease BN (tRNA processing enzyme)
MEIRILGAHASESKESRCISILIDRVLAIDAGGLAATLSLKDQKKIKSILLTHAHFDHIKDIPLMALNLFRMNATIKVHAIPEVNASVTTHLLDGTIYPVLQKLPVDNPTVTFHKITPCQEQEIEGYRVLAVPVQHTVKTVGYQVTDAAGKALFYSADTGPGLADYWKDLSFQLLIIDTTFPNSYEDYARFTGHLTPKLLLAELRALREIKGSLPRVVCIHRDPLLERRVEREIARVSALLGIPIAVGVENARFVL